MALKATSIKMAQNVFIEKHLWITFIYPNLFFITHMALKALVYCIIGAIFAISGIFGAMKYVADTAEPATEGNVEEVANDTGKYFENEGKGAAKQVEIYAYLAIFFAVLSPILALVGIKL